MNLKEQLFIQFASNGLTELLKQFQEKYAPKKGMRFNKNNITYEIGAPKVADASIEYEISSKMPQDELTTEKGKEAYFEKVKKMILSGKEKPVSVEMENIVWDAEKETEKKRDYVKLLYRYPFESLYEEKQIIKEAEEFRRNPGKADIVNIPGVMTTVGKFVLIHLREKIISTARNNIEAFIQANEAVQKTLCK